MTIITNPLMRIIIRQQEIGEYGMTGEVLQERRKVGIVIRFFGGQMPLGMRPMTFTTLSTCNYLIPIPTRERELQK